MQGLVAQAAESSAESSDSSSDHEWEQVLQINEDNEDLAR